MARNRAQLVTPRVTLDVTDEIIDSAIRCDSSNCMIAETIKVTCPWASGIAVDLQTIRFSDPGKRLRYIYLTPRLGQEKLMDFDEGIRPEPFTIRLERGQVTRMATRRAREATPPTPAQRRAKLVPAKTSAGNTGARNIPTIEGGEPPPIGPLSSGATGQYRKGRPRSRRQFGLRALERGSSRLLPNS